MRASSRHLICLLAIGLMAVAMAGRQAAAGDIRDDANYQANALTCESLIAAAERQLRVPTQLLHAIAIVESL